MLILDYRDGFIKDIPDQELNFMAPECYIEVQESVVDDVFKYTYSEFGKGERMLDWQFTIEEIKEASVSFSELESMYLRRSGCNRSLWPPYRKVLLLKKETIASRRM